MAAQLTVTAELAVTAELMRLDVVALVGCAVAAELTVATELMRLDVLGLVLVVAARPTSSKSSFGFPRAPRGRDTHKTGVTGEIFPALPHSVKQCDSLAIGTLRGHFAESAAALRGVFRSPGLRRIELAFLGSILGIYANVVAVSIYAFHHGGATAVGLVMFARMGAAAVSAPFMASFADRHEQRRVMLATDLVRVGTLAAIAAVGSRGRRRPPSYGLAILTSIVSTAFRPAEASLIPRLAETPEELTAANVTSSTFDSVGAFAGPAAGALLYALGGPTLAFLCVSLTYLWSASFVARIPKTERPAAGAARSTKTQAGSPPASAPCGASRACAS